MPKTFINIDKYREENIKKMKIDKKKLDVVLAGRDMNRRDLAVLLERSPQSISQIEQTTQNRPTTVARIARALNVGIADIIKDEQE